MRIHRMAMALAGTVVLLVAVGTASANRLSISNQNFRVVWRSLGFYGTGSGFSAECSVTMEGSFHSRTITKTPGALIGFITRMAIAHPCPGGEGEVWALNGSERIEALGLTTFNRLPWHVRYRGFTGSLPNITDLRLEVVDASFIAKQLSLLCLYRSTAASPLVLVANLSGGTIEAMETDINALIPLSNSSIFCPATAWISGVGTVSLLGTTTSINVRLI